MLSIVIKNEVYENMCETKQPKKFKQGYTVAVFLCVDEEDKYISDWFYMAVRLDSDNKAVDDILAIGDTEEEAIANAEIAYEACYP